MKKTRREMSGPKPIVDSSIRHDTNHAVKRKVFKGVVRAKPVKTATAGVTAVELSTVDAEIVENVAFEIKDFTEATSTESVSDTDNHSTETSNNNGDLSVETVSTETSETAAPTENLGINTSATEETLSTLSLDNTKKELTAAAVSLGVEVKGWWGKQKILDSIQG